MLFTAAERRLLTGLLILLVAGYGLEALRAARIGPYRDEPSPGLRFPGVPPEDHPGSRDSSTALLRETKIWPYRDGFLDLNLADSLDLVGLPGIGPALAGRILGARQARGTFSSVEQLLEVRGIGEKRLARLRELVSAADRCSLHAPPLRFSECIPANRPTGDSDSAANSFSRK